MANGSRTRRVAHHGSPSIHTTRSYLALYWANLSNVGIRPTSCFHSTARALDTHRNTPEPPFSAPHVAARPVPTNSTFPGHGTEQLPLEGANSVLRLVSNSTAGHQQPHHPMRCGPLATSREAGFLDAAHARGIVGRHMNVERPVPFP